MQSPARTTSARSPESLTWLTVAALLLAFVLICCVAEIVTRALMPRNQGSPLNLLSQDRADYAPWVATLNLPAIPPAVNRAIAADRATVTAAAGSGTPTPVIVGSVPTVEVDVVPAAPNFPTPTSADIFVIVQPTATPRPVGVLPTRPPATIPAVPPDLVPPPEPTDTQVVAGIPTSTQSTGAEDQPTNPPPRTISRPTDTSEPRSTPENDTPTPIARDTVSPGRTAIVVSPVSSTTPRPPDTPVPPPNTARPVDTARPTDTAVPPTITTRPTDTAVPPTITTRPTDTPRPRPTDVPADTPTNTATPTFTNTPVTPTSTPIPLTNTPSPTLSPTPSTTPTIINTPSSTPTSTVTNTPSTTPTSTITNTPSTTPTNTPTITPTPLPLPPPDVVVTKSGPATASTNAQQVYRVTVQNSSATTPATNVRLTDTPSGVTVDIGTPTTSAGTCAVSAGTVTCDLGTLAPGAIVTIDVPLTPRSVGTLRNTASATLTEADPNPANNTAAVDTTVEVTGFTLTKSVNPTGTVVAGSPVVYTITIENNTGAAVTLNSITDQVNGAFQISDCVPSGGGTCGFTGTTATWSGPVTIANGGTFTLTISGTFEPIPQLEACNVSVSVQTSARPQPFVLNNVACLQVTT
jgi:hypothetical protein